MKNKVSLLGLLGLIGLLGLFTNNPGFYGFFGFFGFFAYNNILEDELFYINRGKAAWNAFLSQLVIFVIALLLTIIFADEVFLIAGFIALFAVSVFVFSISLVMLEKK